MQKNDLLKNGSSIVRILEVDGENVFVIDCIKKTMPQWKSFSFLVGFENCLEEDLQSITEMYVEDIDSLDAESKKKIHERYTLIAPVLTMVANERQRNNMISIIAEKRKVSKQTIRKYLCLFLSYQSLSVFAKKEKQERELTVHEKNIRWGLNKFFYTQNKNSLNTAYMMMLKQKYCDDTDTLISDYPSFYQFRYFYRKNRKEQTYIISRNGLKDYQKNHRPLLGDGVQEFATNIGTAMFDSTVCDIYLINEAGQLVGRPILTACIDVFSSLCCGYSLSWEGGTYSLRGLMTNIVEDKVQHCKEYGISIKKADWDCDKLPAVFVTDMGAEYKSENFEQISELGITIVNLPPYRPELKGSVEKFFDLVQGYFKPYLKGKGIIEPDFQERGSHDYRKDACLTMIEFQRVILRCILYYNSQRIIENFPYTDIMLKEKVKPYANEIWNWGKTQIGANLISADSRQLILTLLPRTNGKFSRFGLRVNKMRYHCDGFTEYYLKGKTVTVAYNPDNVTSVWLIENGLYTEFSIIEARYKDKALKDVEQLQTIQRVIIKEEEKNNMQAQIDLAKHIEAIADSVYCHADVNIKNIRITRKKEQNKCHIDYVKDGGINV